MCCISQQLSVTVVHVSSVAAQMMFCFETFSGTCEGNLLGVVNNVADCCLPSPRGLGGGGFVPAGTEDCTSCMSFIGKDHRQQV